MKRRTTILLSTFISVLVLTVTLVFAASETEPNDTPAQANTLEPREVMGGAVDPLGDEDYFVVEGVNALWGFIALLQTDNSAASQAAVLTAYGGDGSTVLAQDGGSWIHGSGIALQAYEGPGSHYLEVQEEGNDAQVTTYTLRYYPTVVNTHPEVEPNETRLSGTPSTFTNAGVLSTGVDRDCYAFEGHGGDMILLALDGDPEHDGSIADPALELVDTSDATLGSADASGLGGNEFLEAGPLPEDGVYAYCVSNQAPSGAPTATYRAGIVRNGGLYLSSYDEDPTWLDRPPGGQARVGQTLSFRLAISNTGPLPIPGDINLSAGFDEACLGYIGAGVSPTDNSAGYLAWDGLKPEGLAPGEVYSIDVDFEALAPCSGTIHQGTYVDHFFTGSGGDAAYDIGIPTFLPMVLRSS